MGGRQAAGTLTDRDSYLTSSSGDLFTSGQSCSTVKCDDISWAPGISLELDYTFYMHLFPFSAFYHKHSAPGLPKRDESNDEL